MKKNYQFKYGDKSVTIPVDEIQVIQVINGNDITPLSDIRTALLNSLDTPIDSEPLSTIAQKAGKIALIVSDMTRYWMRQDVIVPLLIDYLVSKCGKSYGDLEIIIATGTHIGGEEEELRKLVTSAVFDKVRTVNHDCKAGDLVYLGTTSYGSRVPATEADRNLVFTEVNRMKDGIIELSRELLTETPDTVNKVALETAVTTAKALVEQGALKDVIPAVADEFDVALAEAQTILADPNANQATVDASFFRLAKAIQMVDFKQGNKEELIKLIDEYSKLDEKDYTADSWKVFKDALDAAIAVRDDVNALEYEVQEALNNLKDGYAQLVVVADKSALQSMVDRINGLEENLYTPESWAKLADPMTTAQAVLDNPTATQDEVNAAYEALVRAYLDLRLKPNKDLLKDLINKAEGLDSANYTKASFDGLTRALNEAKAVFDNPNASQVEVDNAKDVLAKAIAGLQTKTLVNNGDTTSVKTGDNSLAGMFAGLALLSVAGYTVLKRKEN